MAQKFKKLKKVVILTHENPDGDAIGSALALFNSLITIGCKCIVGVPDEPPQNYSFLKGFDKVIITKQDIIKELIGTGHTLITLDSISPKRVGIESFPTPEETLAIDHHPSTEDYGQVMLVEPEISSTAELLYHVLALAGLPMPDETLEGLYTGIITDTGAFKYPNTKEGTHLVVAELIKLGLITSKIAAKIYENMTLANRKLLGKAMERLALAMSGKLAITAITWKDLTDFEAEVRDTDFIVDEVKKLGGPEVYILAKEYRPDQFRISMRGRGKIDLSELSSKFGGGGHHDAAGFTTTGDWLFVRSNLLQIFEPLLTGND